MQPVEDRENFAENLSMTMNARLSYFKEVAPGNALKIGLLIETNKKLIREPLDYCERDLKKKKTQMTEIIKAKRKREVLKKSKQL